MIIELHCPIQHYAWGSTDAIPALLGVANDDGQPWAEMWMGAHPKAPATTPSGAALDELIATDPARYLGTTAQARLPFLFKLLSAAEPLSIQCHPSREQARAGFAREDALGIDRGAPNRNYRDDNHKPELVVAMGEFWALRGFRPASDIADHFEAAGLAELPALAPALAVLRESAAIETFFATLLGLGAEDRGRLLEQLSANLSALDADEARWIAELMGRYPGDVGATAPLFLHLLRLDEGDALYLDAGVLHAYLGGTALEIMASSDNVLRGGLTPKHVDRDELMKVVDFAPSGDGVLRPIRSGAILRYQTPCSDFELSLVDAGDDALVREKAAPSIVLCLDGSVELFNDNERVELGRGQVAFCSADSAPWRLRGHGRAALATHP
jgi:mannose-6-phosphate isomerase